MYLELKYRRRHWRCPILGIAAQLSGCHDHNVQYRNLSTSVYGNEEYICDIQANLQFLIIVSDISNLSKYFFGEVSYCTWQFNEM